MLQPEVVSPSTAHFPRGYATPHAGDTHQQAPEFPDGQGQVLRTSFLLHHNPTIPGMRPHRRSAVKFLQTPSPSVVADLRCYPSRASLIEAAQVRSGEPRGYSGQISMPSRDLRVVEGKAKLRPRR